jgi:hypothetical protein
MALGLSFTSCGSSNHAATSPTTATTFPVPKVSAAQQDQYFRDVSKTAPLLSSYVQQQGQAALSAILAYGSGFCVFVENGEAPSDAVTSVQTGAQKIAAKTHFPASSNTTFESIATAALLALCPAEQAALSPQEFAQLRQIEQELGTGQS